MRYLRFSIPVKSDNTFKMEMQGIKYEAAHQDSHPHLTDLTIMIVDDEVSTMEIVKAYLETAGYRKFFQVEQSRQAIMMMEETNPDILLLDLMMPEVSGFDILKAVRTHTKFKHMPVIIMTVSTDPNDKLKALDMGATDFLAKPLDPSELCLRVRNTLEAKAYHDQLAFYDRLTSLPNRHMFLDRMDWILKKAERYNEKLALLNIALDNFDRINATIGAGAADEVLRQIAMRIEGVIREVDVLGHPVNNENSLRSLFRIEGSTFSLLLERVRNEQNAAIVADRIIGAIREPFHVDGQNVYVRTSIGISVYPTESEDRDTLVKLASRAADYIKNRSGDSFYFSSRSVNKIYSKRKSIESMLKKALERDEFVLYYQPKVEVSSGVVKGVETLLRWKSDGHGYIPPEDFIPVAEETGLIIPLGEYILSKAFNQLSEWQKTGRDLICMSVNLSAKQFQNPDFSFIVNRIIKNSNVDARFLTLEITESLLMKDIEHAIDTLYRFSEMGLNLSIDDFGTGYSSFSYLSDLPVNELKIDKSFISNIPDNLKSCNIVSTILFLARNLGLKTVAEGIEKEAQLDYLKKEQCDQYQGYLFSKPLSSSEVCEILPKKTC